MNTVEIYCENSRSYIKLQGGETLAEAAKLVQPDFEPVCARVNNKTEGMHFCVYHPKTVEFMPATSPSGERAYVRSLCMLLYRAVSRVAPEARRDCSPKCMPRCAALWPPTCLSSPARTALRR